MKASHTKITNAKSIEEVLEQANSSWDIIEVPIMTCNGLDIQTHKSIVREDNNDILGIVGKSYHPISNVKAFAFFDEIVKQNKATYSDYYEVDGGKRVIVEAILGQFDAKVGDVIEKRAKLINSFNGTNSFTISFEALRLVCSNGMTRSEKESSIKVRHTKNHDLRIQESFRILGYADKSYEKFMQQCRILAERRVDKIMVEQFLNDLLGENDSTRKVNQKNEIERLFNEGLGNNGATAWDLYNGATEYFDHHKGRDEEKRLASSLVGSSKDLKTKAFNLALAL